MTAIAEVAPAVGVRVARGALAVAHASSYRARQPQADPVQRKAQPRAMSGEYRIKVADVFHSERFGAKSPSETSATLLDERTNLCPVKTMSRKLGDHQEVRERRNQLRHPSYSKPQLLDTGANQVWSWVITKLFGLAEWTYLYLYVIIEIFSRHTVGWIVAQHASVAPDQRLLDGTCTKEAIETNPLVIYADREPSMTSRTVTHLMADLSITNGHSLTFTSTAKPFSESQIRTMKYRPGFPDRLGCVQDARVFGQTFFNWYNFVQHHSGITYLPPATVPDDQAETITNTRPAAPRLAYAERPERFAHGMPRPPAVPSAVWINPSEGDGDSNEDLQ